MLDYILLSPSIYLLNLTLLFLWYGVYKKHKLPNYNLSEHFGYISIFILLWVFYLEFSILLNYNFFNLFLFNNTFYYTSITSSVILITLIASILTILISIMSERSTRNFELILEVNILRLFIIFSLLTIAISDNLIIIFFLLEIYSLSSYILVGKNSKFSVFSGESALKYFFISSVFSILMIYSLASLYSITGLINISELKMFLTIENSNINFYLYKTFLILLFSIFFKLSAAPFHFWAPDVYEGMPTTIMFFLSVIPKIVLFYLIIKLNFLFSDLWLVLLLSAVLSSYIGSTMGVYQVKFKRLLAYSMISNTGLLVGILAWSSNTTISSYFFVYILIYTLTLIGLFGLFLSNRGASTGVIFKNLFSFTNLSDMNSTKFILFTAMIFTSAGIPPFIGFLIKYLILFSYTINSINLFGILIILLSLTALSVFYYIRIIKIMSFIKKRFWLFYANPAYSSTYLIILTFILSIIFLLFASTLHELFLLFFIV